MKSGSNNSVRDLPVWLLALLAAAGLVGGCGGGSDGSSVDATVIRSSVTAASGGSFSSDDGAVTVEIPAGALDRDTSIEVIKVSDSLPPPSGALAAAGPIFNINLSGAQLSEAMSVEFHVDTAPAFPQLGESARLVNGQWQRAAANFFRFSSNTVVSLVSEGGIYRPIYRTLQSDSGDMVTRGRDLFLYETFGNEAFFGGVLGLQDVLNNLTPSQAVAAGVQVDLNRVPQAIVDVLTGNDFAAKQAALDDPAVTRALLKADAVVGVKGVFAAPQDDMLSSAGITCALCHVTVEPTGFELSSGTMTSLPIGALKLDGVPNTAMDAGAILALTPFAVNAGAPTVDLLQSFGPGRFDVRALPDNPLDDNVANPTSFPPLWNFVDLTGQDYTLNWDGLFDSSSAPELALASQAEAVYDLVMHANGAFGTDTGTLPPQLSTTPPQSLLDALQQAEADQPGNVIPQQDLVDVQAFERSIVSPEPAAYDEALAEQGFLLFNGKGQCSGCHRTAEFTGPVVSADITLDQPQGGLAGGIKTPGLRGVSHTAPYFHDGSAATLDDVLDVYSGRIVNALTGPEKQAIAEYLKSL